MKLKAFVSIITFFTLFLISSPSTFAVTVSIINPQANLTQDDFTLNVAISGAKAGDNYLRVEIYSAGTTNYFGDTKVNDGSWQSKCQGVQCYKVAIQSGVDWNGPITGRIGNPSSKDFSGNGNYKLRIMRYTSSGSEGSSDSLNSVDVTINTSFPTSTSSPSPTSTSSATPTSVPASSPTPSDSSSPSPAATDTPTYTQPDPTSTPTPSSSDQTGVQSGPTPSPTDTLIQLDQPTSTPIPTPTPTTDLPTPTPTFTSESIPISTFGAVLGISSEGGLMVDKKSNNHKGNKKTNQNFSLAILFGFFLLGSCGILIGLKTERGRKIWKKFF